MCVPRHVPGKEVKKCTLSTISYEENIFMHKVTSILRYDLNIKVNMLTFEKIMLGFRLSKSSWFGTNFHINISFGLSLHLFKPDHFTKGF